MVPEPPQRTLTIYLVNDEITDASTIIRSGTVRHSIRLGRKHFGDLYVKVGKPHSPPWVSFFGDTVDLASVQGMSTAAVLIIRSGKRYFAVTFGFGRLLLQAGTTDERFGLKVTLNAVDHTQIRSVDRVTLDSPAPHSQIQASNAANISDFGLDIDQDLLRAVTGKPRDTTFGKRLTGKDALRTTGPFTMEQLPTLLQRYLAESAKKDYLEHFPWVDNVQEVKTNALKHELNEILEGRLQRQEFDAMWLAVPERIDWQTIDAFAYQATPGAARYADIHFRTFLESIRHPTTVTIEALRRRYRVRAIGTDTGEAVYEWPVFQCIYAEVSHKDAQYLLNNGTWYHVDTNFRNRTERSFSQLPRSKRVFLTARPDEDEQDYNKRIAASDAATFALMDRKTVRYPDPHSPIEFCDLYTTAHEIIHVKPYAGSSTLSHLFAQGVTSGMLFAQDAGFRRAVNQKLPVTHRLPHPEASLEPRTNTVTYAIMSASPRPLNIPFFSKVTLSRAAKTLRNNGYDVSIAKITVA